jgi:4-amino-4-deoxy-L-arabinose transferase-like glycosyltransferase
MRHPPPPPSPPSPPSSPSPSPSPQLFAVLLALAIVVNFSGISLTIIGIDGTLYASIAKTMALQGNFVDLFANGTDWLDKPHFPFWITALSFRAFGFSDWSYKLPAILFLMGGAGYTYLLALRLYQSVGIARWSVLILLTALHVILSNTDVRAEPYLTALVIGAIYHFQRAWTENRFVQLLLGSLLAGCAVMTKGLFALVPIVAAIGGHLLLTRNWKELLHVRWLVAAFLTFLFFTPELVALYVQFDLHPEKVVFGRTGVSGLRFFFWDSQFGRFFNTGPIKGKGDPTFFFHTVIWSFLPWSLLLYAAMYRRIRPAPGGEGSREWYTVAGSLVTFLMFSFSGFQLPHYLNIVFPLFAIVTASFIHDLRGVKGLRNTQYTVIALMFIAIGLLHGFFRPDVRNLPVSALMVLVLVLFVLLPRLFRASGKEIVVGRSVLAAVLVNLYFNGFFYPKLHTYQGGTTAAIFANASYKGVPVVQLASRYSHALALYLDTPPRSIPSLSHLSTMERPFLLVLHEDDGRLPFEPVGTFEDFRITMLTGRFIDPATRASQIKRYNLYLIR